MGRASLLREKGKMMFEEVYSVWTERRLTQEEAGLNRRKGTHTTPRRRFGRGVGPRAYEFSTCSVVPTFDLSPECCILPAHPWSAPYNAVQQGRTRSWPIRRRHP